MGFSNWLRGGLAGLLLSGGGARAEAPRSTPPWQVAALGDPLYDWSRQAVYPLPEVVVFVSAEETELYAEPARGARVVTHHPRYTPLPALLAAPWLPEGFVAVFERGRLTGFMRRGAVTGERPALAGLLAESRAALGNLDMDGAQRLAQLARALYPGDALASKTARAFELLDCECMPPEFASPGARLPRPGAHVVPGATLYVRAAMLPVVKTPHASTRPSATLPIHTPVRVLDVRGGWARVRYVPRPLQAGLIGGDGKLRWRTLPEAEALEDEGPIQGYVPARYLTPRPMGARALREEAHALLKAGARDEALAVLEAARAAEGPDEGLWRELLELALERDRMDLAVRLAWELSELEPAPEEVSERVPVQNSAGEREEIEIVPWPSVTPALTVTLNYGCRGDPHRAEVLDAGALPSDWEGPPADACLAAVDAHVPYPPTQDDGCGGVPWYRARKEERSRYEAERRTFLAKLKRLRRLFPQGPSLCVDVENTAASARVDMRVQYYALPASELSYCAGTPQLVVSGAKGLRMGEFVVPFLGSGDRVKVCIEVSRYEDMRYGALAAPDLPTAERFVRQLARFQDEDSLDWSTTFPSSKTTVFSEQYAHVQESTALEE